MAGFLNKTVLLYGLVFFAVIFPERLNAYILEGPHILYLAEKKMGAPETLRVLQNLTYYNEQDPPAQVQETLSYRLPGEFRSDIVTDETSRIYVFSNYNAVTITDEKTASIVEDLLEYYKDPLLFRSREILEERLGFLGVPVTTVSLGRFENQICYIIGAMYPDETLPQIWIEKETFLPVRFLLPDQSDPDQEKIIEFRYLSWMKTEKIWYPMQVETYIDDELIRKADAASIEINVPFDDRFFDVNHLQTIYPPASAAPYEENQTDELDDVQQSIEDLKRRFD
jgi:outer membrane lipoprotein-sorting protein